MPGNHGKIVGGTDASHGEFPYQVKWGDFGNLGGCGASILNENYVLTAAHCCEDYPNKLVIGGEHILDQDDGSEQSIAVKSAHIHPDYGLYIVRNDVCILEVIL